MVKTFVETRYRPFSVLPCARSSILFIVFAYRSSGQVLRSSLWLKQTMVQYAVNPNVRTDYSTRSQSVSSEHHAHGTLEIFTSSYSLSRTINSIEQSYFVRRRGSETPFSLRSIFNLNFYFFYSFMVVFCKKLLNK